MRTKGEGKMSGKKSYEIPPEARAQVMAGLALAWDGQWFLKVHDRFGWDAAAELNFRTRNAFGRIEMRSTLQALGKRKADNLQDALEVWQAYFRMFGADRGVFAGDYAIEGEHPHGDGAQVRRLGGGKAGEVGKGCPGLPDLRKTLADMVCDTPARSRREPGGDRPDGIWRSAVPVPRSRRSEVTHEIITFSRENPQATRCCYFRNANRKRATMIR